MGINGKRLRSLRIKKGLVPQDMADYLHITRQAYSKYENGNIKNPRKLQELANFFEVSTDYLLGIDQNNISEKKSSLYEKINNADEDILQDLEAYLDYITYKKKQETEKNEQAQ